MTNSLARETSPYLLQHAGNPVDWHPWGEEALALARESGKPILLSVGYSACHWCHVMAHESFEDPATAAVMNEHFVNIKVDREERPDIDQIYQNAHSLLSRRSGGWPLTMFLTPEQIPFYGGTYFPPTPRYGLPGFTDLLRQIAAAWQERRAEIEEQNAAVMGVLEKVLRQDAPAALDGAAVTAAVAQLAQTFDAVNGGFGGAPKFPNPADLALLIGRAAAGDGHARDMACLTLSKMAGGGIYDHVGGGFCRYSVDDHWEIPHFEKMLYDNGQLLGLYSDAWLMTGDVRYRCVVEETVAWLLRDMRAPGGAFYSSLDADSEGEEGKYYVWQRDEVRTLLDEQEYALLKQRYGLDSTPNFEHAWHLHISADVQTAARKLAIAPDELDKLWQSARARLLDARVRRIPPGRDEKLLTSWNALTIHGLAKAGRALAQPAWIAAAQGAVDFMRDAMWKDGRLLATCKDGRAHLNAYLDDHAYLLQALLESMQAKFRLCDLTFAVEIADALLARFEDVEAGGFFFTSHDHESLIQRAKPAYDNATPSGNGIAANALLHLGHLLGETRYLQAAENTLRAFAATLQRSPAACPSLAAALEAYLVPGRVLILRGPAEEMAEWKRQLDRQWLPGMMVFGLPSGMPGLPEVLDRATQDTRVNAWLCQGVSCLPPIDTLEALQKHLRLLGTDGGT